MAFSAPNNSSSISGSTDAALNNPTTGEVFSYDTTIAKWRNSALTKARVGLGNVDNTSDANKPVSNAQATALGTKADDNDVVHRTGNESILGIKTFSNAPVIPDASLSIAKTSGLQTSLNGKVTAVTTNAKLWIGTQAAYNAIATKDATTLYAIV